MSNFGPDAVVMTVPVSGPSAQPARLYDLKIIENSRHTAFTGYSNESIHENLHWLAEVERPVIVRFPLLPGISDDPENVGALAVLVSSLSTRYPVDVLPYHKAGVDKYARLDKEHSFPELESPTEDRIEQVVCQLREYDLQVTVRGERV